MNSPAKFWIWRTRWKSWTSSGNALSSLPDDLHRLRKLRILFCSNNQFTELPAVMGRCEALEMVGFKANRIRHVPATPCLSGFAG